MFVFALGVKRTLKERAPPQILRHTRTGTIRCLPMQALPGAGRRCLCQWWFVVRQPRNRLPKKAQHHHGSKARRDEAPEGAEQRGLRPRTPMGGAAAERFPGPDNNSVRQADLSPLTV